MAVPSHINSKYSAVIVEDTRDTLTKQITFDPISQGFLENIKNNTSEPPALSTSGKVTEVALNDSTWTPLPATALTGRNAISIQNASDDEIKVNFDNTVGYVGMIINSGAERYYDITESIVVYGRSATGTTPTINIEELA